MSRRLKIVRGIGVRRLLVIKAYAYDKIKEHLKYARTDRRHKERMRAKIAMRHIAHWFKEGKHEYANTIPAARI
jgi:hypothetical protein